MKLFGGYMAYMAASASALDPAEWLKIKFQSTQLQGVNQQVNLINLAIFMWKSDILMKDTYFFIFRSSVGLFLPINRRK